MCVCGVNNAAQGKPNKQTVKQTVEPKSMQRFCFACCLFCSLFPSLSLCLSLSFFPVCSAAAPRFAFKQKPLKTLYYRILELFKYFPPPPYFCFFLLRSPLLAPWLTLQLGNYCSFIFSVPSPSSLFTACAPATTTKRLKFSNICAKLWKKMQQNNS